MDTKIIPGVALAVLSSTSIRPAVCDGLVISAELDDGVDTWRAVEWLEDVLGSAATCVVASGGEWVDGDGTVHPKLHEHWRLAQPARTPEQLAMLKQCRRNACYLVGGDPTCASTVHPLRWPGSWHCKAEPRLAEIVALTDAEVDLSQASIILDEAARRFGVPEPVRKPVKPATAYISGGSAKAVHPRFRKYATDDLQEAIKRVATAPPHQFHITLNRETYSLSQRYIKTHALSPQEVGDAMAAAATARGGHSEQEITATIVAAMTAAYQKDY